MLSPQRSSPLVHAQVVQTSRDQHREIREPIFGIAQDIFDDARAFDSGDSMFNPHAHARDALVGLFLSVRQLTLTRLFFGW